jgi:hypothetical protein
MSTTARSSKEEFRDAYRIVRCRDHHSMGLQRPDVPWGLEAGQARRAWIFHCVQEATVPLASDRFMDVLARKTMNYDDNDTYTLVEVPESERSARIERRKSEIRRPTNVHRGMWVYDRGDNLWHVVREWAPVVIHAFPGPIHEYRCTHYDSTVDAVAHTLTETPPPPATTCRRCTRRRAPAKSDAQQVKP